jgi:hypothetical protein
MAAKETWQAGGDVAGARDFLARAFRAGHTSERLWLAAVKMEWVSGEVDRARALLRARAACPTAPVFVKSALLERVELSKLRVATAAAARKEGLSADPSSGLVKAEPGSGGAKVLSAQLTAQLTAARKLLEASRAKFPKCAKLWMMAGQLEEDQANWVSSGPMATGDAAQKDAALREARAAARNLYLEGLKYCKDSPPLWLVAASLEERSVSAVKVCVCKYCSSCCVVEKGLARSRY